MNRNWPGKLLLCAYISWKKLCSHTFKASSEKVIVCILRKWRLNARKRVCERVFFVSLQVGISRLHYNLTSSQTVIRDFKYILSKCLKSTSEIHFYCMCRSSHQRCSVRKGVLKNFVKFIGKHLCFSLFFNKVTGWKPEIVRNSYWRCSVKKVVLKKAQWCSSRS